MRKIKNTLYKILLMLIVIVCGCTFDREKEKSLWMQDNGKIKVMCTTAMVADIVKAIGKECVDVLTLIEGQSDPHTYQLVKGDNEKFHRADLVFANGLGLEHGPSLAAILHGSSKVYQIGDYVMKKVPERLLVVDGTVDPHIWMDLSLWKLAIPYVRDALVEKQPEKKEYFYQNASEQEKTYEKVHRAIFDTLQTIPEEKRYLVTAHDAFNYFTYTYLAEGHEREDHSWKIRCSAPEGLAPESQLSTSDIQRIVNHIELFNICVIFAESNVSKDSVRKLQDALEKKKRQLRIAKEVLFADAMGEKETEGGTHLGMIQYNARVIYENLLESC